jgi:hypothetical protein
MRKLLLMAVGAIGLYGLASWWRRHRRAGTDLMNRVVNPWFERHGVIAGSRGEIGLIEHVGRKSGIVRRTLIHPMPTADGFRFIVPVGERSEWARNVIAAGRCRLVADGQTLELGEPALELPAHVPDLPRPIRALFGWLGFRYLRMQTTGTAAADVTDEVEASRPDFEPAAA